MRKFKVGDHVIVSNSVGSGGGMKGIISDIRPDVFTKYYLYEFITPSGIIRDNLYFYDKHLTIDSEWLREEKIKKILNGIS